MFYNTNWSCFFSNANSMLNCIPSKVKSKIWISRLTISCEAFGLHGSWLPPTCGTRASRQGPFGGQIIWLSKSVVPNGCCGTYKQLNLKLLWYSGTVHLVYELQCCGNWRCHCSHHVFFSQESMHRIINSLDKMSCAPSSPKNSQAFKT